MTIKLTADAVKAEIVRLAEETPDYSYPETLTECRYTPDDELPSCIVGKALLNLGVKESTLAMFEGRDAIGVMKELGITTIYEYSRTALWVKIVQKEQDDGVVWGEAVQRADAVWGA